MEVPDYQDDPEIPVDDVLYRRVRSVDWNPGERRPTSAAFSDSKNGTPMSVVLRSLLTADARTPESTLDVHPGFGLVAIAVGSARAMGFAVAIRPAVVGEPAHAWVVGKKTQGLRKRLAKECVVVVSPPRIE